MTHVFRPLPQTHANRRKRGASPSLPWPVCVRCGLVALMNDVSIRAARAACPGADDA